MKSFSEYLRQTDPSFLNESSDENDAQIVHLYHHYPRIDDIKKEMGISGGHLYRVLQRNGVDPYRRQKASRDAVIYYYDAGLSLSEIARLTDYIVRNIRNIVNVHTFNDRPEEPLDHA